MNPDTRIIACCGPDYPTLCKHIRRIYRVRVRQDHRDPESFHKRAQQMKARQVMLATIVISAVLPRAKEPIDDALVEWATHLLLHGQDRLNPSHNNGFHADRVTKAVYSAFHALNTHTFPHVVGSPDVVLSLQKMSPEITLLFLCRVQHHYPHAHRHTLHLGQVEAACYAHCLMSVFKTQKEAIEHINSQLTT